MFIDATTRTFHKSEIIFNDRFPNCLSVKNLQGNLYPNLQYRSAQNKKTPGHPTITEEAHLKIICKVIVSSTIYVFSCEYWYVLLLEIFEEYSYVQNQIVHHKTTEQNYNGYKHCKASYLSSKYLFQWRVYIFSQRHCCFTELPLFKWNWPIHFPWNSYSIWRGN